MGIRSDSYTICGFVRVAATPRERVRGGGAPVDENYRGHEELQASAFLTPVASPVYIPHLAA